MKRDWDLVRTILIQLEQKTDTRGAVRPGQINGWDEETVSEHMRLLDQAGLIEAVCNRPQSFMPCGYNLPTQCVAMALTWSGHEFLDSIRKDSAWYAIANEAKSRGLDLSFEAIKALAAYLLSNLTR